MKTGALLDRLDRLDRLDLGVKILGVSTICLGIACLLQRDFATPWQPAPAWLPFRQPLAFAAAGLLVLSGLALFIPRTRPIAALVQVFLFVVYAAFWLSVPFGPVQPWLGIAEELAIAVGVATLWARSIPGSSRLVTPAIVRVVYGLCSIMFAAAHVLALSYTAAVIPKWIPGSAEFWALFTAVAHLLVGVALIANRFAILATRLGGLMYLGFALLVWVPLIAPDVHQWLNWAGGAITLVLMGALWLVGDYLSREQGAD